ncbi:MAG: hypothetical protein Q8Q12_11140 [bacterium]|nr:hypothetical protein [bacterium]
MKRMSVTTKPHRTEERHGIALLLTLGILLLLTLLALSFTSSQLTENEAAKNFHYSAKAEEIALGGLETAIGVLAEDSRNNSCDHLFERWAIYYQGNDGFAGHDSDDADLSDYDEIEYGVDEGHDILDFSTRRDPWKAPLPDSRWIKVVATDPATGSKRVVGRYVVCIEDESAKVNINTAGNPDRELLREIAGHRRLRSISWKHCQNMGVTTAEADLAAILDYRNVYRDHGLRVLFATVFDDLGINDYPYNVDSRTALDIVAYRYGWRRGMRGGASADGLPGSEDDDNMTTQLPECFRQDKNGIDDDGDGMIDEPGEEADEPGEFDPYDPLEARAPGQLFMSESHRPGETGVMGNDTPYLTVSHVRMAESMWGAGKHSIGDRDYEAPYPKDRLYLCLLPYITVYSQDLNRFSSEDLGDAHVGSRVTWMQRENIGDWLNSPSKIEDFLKRIRFSYPMNQTLGLQQIAVNLYDFIDRDWFPTTYRGVVGIEPSAYLNELEADPPDLPGTVAGLNPEEIVEDYGEYIELWNPYDVAMDVADYYVTIDESGNTRRTGAMAVASPVIPPRTFFVIGDTLGEVRRTEGMDEVTLPPYPLGCQAYGPLNLDPPFVDIYLEIDVPGRGRIPVETHYPVPFAPPEHHTLQKDDPRVPWGWDHGPPTPGRMNATVTVSEKDAYSSFYAPGIRTWMRDPSFKPGEADFLEHAGGLASLGELGMVHRSEPWQTLNFTGMPQYGTLDDVRLLDLLSLPCRYRCRGDLARLREYVPGRININTASPEVLLGLNWEPVIEEMKSHYWLGVGLDFRYKLIQHIIGRRSGGRGRTNPSPYRNLAEVACDLAQLIHRYYPEAPQAAKEAFMRHNAYLITTKSSIFKVTVLAEAFDRKGNAAASRKLEAIVDRGYTPGTFNRPGEDTPTALDRSRRETARTLYFRWITED